MAQSPEIQAVIVAWDAVRLSYNTFLALADVYANQVKAAQLAGLAVTPSRFPNPIGHGQLPLLRVSTVATVYEQPKPPPQQEAANEAEATTDALPAALDP